MVLRFFKRPPKPKHQHDFYLVDIHHGKWKQVEDNKCCETANIYWVKLCRCGLVAIDSQNLKVEEKIDITDMTMNDVFEYMKRHIPPQDLNNES